LSQIAEFLPYYALPYVPDARSHPSYYEIFTDKWSPALGSRLQRFLSTTLCQAPSPRLLELFHSREAGGRASNGGGDSQVWERRLSESDRKVTSYAKKFTRIQSDYHNLIGITANLVDTLESSIQVGICVYFNKHRTVP